MSRKYLIGLILVSLLAGLGIFSWNYFMPLYASSHAWFVLAWYVAFTAALHYWLMKSADARTFIMKFLGVTGVKLFLNLVVILVYGLNNKARAIPFALMFMVLYFLFTIFESRQLIIAFKPKKEEKA